MGGARSFAAIADAAEDAAEKLIDVIGLCHPRWGLPHRSTIRRVLIAAGAPALEAALRRWATRRMLAHAQARTAQLRRRPGTATEMAWATNAFALDGKVATGSAHPEPVEQPVGAADDQPSQEPAQEQEQAARTVRAAFVSVLHVDSGITITQSAIEGGDEVAAAQAALEDLAAAVDLRGCVITADARHTVRATATQILGYGAHYVFAVKANTPTLYDLLAEQPWVAIPPAPGQAGGGRERGHARKESRSIKVLGCTEEQLAELRKAIPGATQMLQMTRTRTTLADTPVPRPRTARKPKKGKGKAASKACKTSKTPKSTTPKKTKVREVVYYVTSMDHTTATPAALAAWIRGHWTIENRVHHVRDVTLGEDASRVRTGSGPQVMAAIRNTVISLARLFGRSNVARTTRRWCRREEEALAVLLAA
ncbi:Transposase DDE domain-containing protein [Quadrisphaera granulorum]|uniref:DDE family transposase n=1 Tax=Quadrisphaera granulorum TaxID=317664 RepID=A0A316AAP3_9ACTN|nr:transposase [Quadrisphaera granulorum]PWJ53924.1 DDE family transposase [Quadrisphaera granulorum]SZE96381.1 Transposase DDE domain-containing protein [Quadrisphaera granulorum]